MSARLFAAVVVMAVAAPSVAAAAGVTVYLNPNGATLQPGWDDDSARDIAEARVQVRR